MNAYTFHDRWRILGKFTTTTPLHIGSGQTTERGALQNKKTEKPSEVQAMTLDYRDRPCIPGTAVKGVLRSWATAFVKDADPLINRLFGDSDVKSQAAQSGRAEFFTAFLDRMPNMEHLPPYWSNSRNTGVLSHVCINRETGTAEEDKLYFEEYVPAGAVFTVEIALCGVSEQEVAFLLAILKEGGAHATHPYQFGANGADGWGRVSWELSRITVIEKTAISLEKVLAAVPFAGCERVRPIQPAALTFTEAPRHVVLPLSLQFTGPFLVNDTSRARTEEDPENSPKTNFTPLRHPDGSAWLPASSFRGALRQRAEWILRTLDPKASGDPNKPAADGPIERLFGQTSNASPLTIEEFRQRNPYAERKQDFVAIDRFTGGAADGAKFNATFVDQPTFSTTLTLNTDGLQPRDRGLFALALRDIARGKVMFGLGAARGYGWAKGVLDPAAEDWLKQQPILPDLSLPTAESGADPQEAAGQTLVEGKLVFQNTKQGRLRRIIYMTKRGKWTIPTPFDQNQLSPLLKTQEGKDIRVQFEWDKKHAVRIRPYGQPWNAGAAAAPGSRPSISHNRFANPYYFLRLEDRTRFIGDLADQTPVPHGRFVPGRYSGTIRVRLTTKTPLLLCDDENLAGNDNGHKTYNVRTEDRNPNGKPLLTSSSVRGMLRAAYEAVTNSRFGVFPSRLTSEDKLAKGHARRLGFRLLANESLNTVPVRIVRSGAGLAAQILAGTSGLTTAGTAPVGAPVFAAWCGTYGWTVPGLTGLAHGAEVWAYLTPWTYSHGRVRFDFWNVEKIVPKSSPMPTSPPTGPLRTAFGRAQPATGRAPKWYEGYLCITLNNMNGKHDERVFFCNARMTPVSLTPANLQQWEELIQNYHDQHRRDIENGRTCPSALNPPCVYSRHISTASRSLATAALQLQPGDLCYARVRNSGGAWHVEALYPVTISRKLYAKSPLDCLSASLRPASMLSELSPADRVFGWVSQETKTADNPAYRGNTRIGPVTCCTTAPHPVQHFNPSIPLAILGQPKPAQGRFYVGASAGAAQPNGIVKEQAGYMGANRIRGAKVYPHHVRFATAPNDPEADWVRRQQGQDSARDNQNRSITGWVKPDVTFEFDIQIDNLSRIELGALVWLLSLPPEHYHRLGLGKPLGFGSVRAEIVGEATLVADGAQWASYYSRWDAEDPKHEDMTPAKDAFCAAINQANPNLLPSFLKSATGFDDPIHYPHLSNQQPGSGEHFRWFVQNERNAKLSLPDLDAMDCSLPREP